MYELDKIVKEMLEKHIGGEIFFDHLDKAIQTTPIIEQLYNMVEKYNYDVNIIVSGKFGTFFGNWYTVNTNWADQMIINVNGGLRTGFSIDNLDYLSEYIRNNKFVFLDDSYYSGKTQRAVRNEIERLGGKLINTFVIYDGSVNKSDDVKSLYRYYK